jgi:hypothetical protein
MGKNKIVFTDCDGVINSEVFFTSAPKEERETMMDSAAVKLLNQLDGAMVVISSSWGEDAISVLREKGLELPIIGCTKHVHHQFQWACRGNEIEEWLLSRYGGMGTKFGKDYESENYDYVIFDDDMDMLLGQAEHFIHVNRHYGLTQENIDQAKKILKI